MKCNKKNCNTCRMDLEAYLCDVPSKWRKQIIDVICNYLEQQDFPCDCIVECLGNEVGTLDPGCLADSPAAWANLTFIQQMQLIIDKVCETFELGTIYLSDTDAISLSGDGSSGDPITATLILDNVTGGGDNIATVTVDGLYVPPFDSETFCNAAQLAYDTDGEQQNTIPQSSYDFTIVGDGGCLRVSPPTGFAVTGSGRISAFGSMEWFESLNDAQTSSVSGETILIYGDASAVDLTPKTGVNYFGVGVKSIKSLTVGTNYIGTFSNIIILEDVAFGGTDSEMFAYNVECKQNAVFTGNAKWNGGKFTANSDTYYINIEDTATVNDIYSTIKVNVINNGTFINSTVIDLTDPGHYTVFADASADDTDSPTLSNLYIYSLNCPALHAVAYNPDGVLTVDRVIAISDGGTGAILHQGNEDAGGALFATNITGKSSVAEGILIVSTIAELSTLSLLKEAASNLNGYSLTSPGLNLINGNIKNSVGYSVADYGIQIGGSEHNGFNLNVIECIGESLGSSGLYATRDIHIVGGTYISRYDNAAGNPILLTASFLQSNNYYVAGAKTVAVNTSAYAIKGDVTVTARISGCQFLNEGLATAVPGIDPLITLNTVSIDSYGNIS